MKLDCFQYLVVGVGLLTQWSVIVQAAGDDCPMVKQVGVDAVNVDGSIDEWDLDETGLDFVANMYTAGDSSKSVGAKLYARLDCDTSTLCIMVNSEDDTTLDPSDGESWFKKYDISSDTLLTTGNGLVKVYDGSGNMVAWEACYSGMTSGTLSNFEVHTNYYKEGEVDPDTASTGRGSSTICIDMTCDKCYLPAGSYSFSLITEGDADVAAHNVYSGVAVGGAFENPNPLSSIEVSAHSPHHKSYVGSLVNSDRVDFKGGVETGISNINDEVISFDHFKWLAQNAKSSQSGNYKVVVVDHGGTFDVYDFNSNGQEADNGNTLAIFNTAETIEITKDPQYGRKFGPSIIAPFAHVIVNGNAGYVDGFIVAKSFETKDNNPSQLQVSFCFVLLAIEVIDRYFAFCKAAV